MTHARVNGLGIASPRLLTAAAALAALGSLGSLAQAGDWSQYHGPESRRTSPETVGLRAWSQEGPPRLWRIPTNTGFSSFTVADGKAYTVVRREVGGKEREACVAVDALSGKELWVAVLGEARYDRGGDSGVEGNKGGDGPRSTPSHADGHVYVLDSQLVLTCLDGRSGRQRWSHDIVSEYGGELIKWQNASSPLVDGNLVFVAGGGPGQSLLAFDSRTGRLRWKTGDETMTHATPVIATIHGVRQVIFFLRSGLVAVAPETGEELWRSEYPFRTSTAASPVVFEDVVYCSAGYGVGAAAFRVEKTEEGFGLELLWRKSNDLMNHWSTPVCKDGFLYGLYGFKKYGSAPLACVDIRTGEMRWSEIGFGPGNCILVGSDLLVLNDSGQVVLVEAVPDEYREVARAKVLEGKCWSSPSFSDGRLYVRSTERGTCLDLSGASSQ